MGKLKKKVETEKSSTEKLNDEIFNNYVQKHGKPVTRREMIASGMIPFAASAIMPSWLKLFADAGVAEAQSAIVCDTGGGSEMPAFIQIKGNGGWAIGANAFALTQAGNIPNDITKYTGGTATNIQIVTEFKNKATFLSTSQFLAGLRSAIPIGSNALTNSSFHIIPVKVGDDSGTQPLAVTHAIAKAGLKGTKFERLGVSGTPDGIDAVAAFDVGLAAPALQVRQETDLLNTLGVSGILRNLSSAQKSKLFEIVKNTSNTQMQALKGLNGAQTLEKLMYCANISNYNLVANPGSLNISVLGNTQVATLWGVTANTASTNSAMIQSALAYNAAMGNSGPVSMTVGGCDYHNGTRTTGDAKDNEIGVLVGRCLQTLALVGKPGMICVCTDGSVQSSVSETPGAPWQSDGGNTSAIYMIAYEPTMTLNVKGTQIGYMTDGGVSSDQFITGSAPGKALAAVLANYLNMMNSTTAASRLETVMNVRPFTTDELDKILVVSRT